MAAKLRGKGRRVYGRRVKSSGAPVKRVKRAVWGTVHGDDMHATLHGREVRQTRFSRESIGKEGVCPLCERREV